MIKPIRRWKFYSICLLLNWTCCAQNKPASVANEALATSKLEEPLETASIGNATVKTIEEETISNTKEFKSNRPCAWANAWKDKKVANPLLAGVGEVPMPIKTFDVELLLPVSKKSSGGEVVAEIVIGPDGNVSESTILHATEPRWPEAEEAILKTINQWKYQAATIDGTPISTCSTLVINL